MKKDTEIYLASMHISFARFFFAHFEMMFYRYPFCTVIAKIKSKPFKKKGQQQAGYIYTHSPTRPSCM